MTDDVLDRAGVDLPPTIVAEVSKSWRDGVAVDGVDAPISHAFERAIAFNRQRGYQLDSWYLSCLAVNEWEINETIVAVFTREERLMSPLHDLIRQHTSRGACRCGRCFGAQRAVGPHAVDMVFFTVALDVEGAGAGLDHVFREATSAHRGLFVEVNPLDGKKHNYLELGKWLGDHGAALHYMALGVSLGVFDLLSPAILPGVEGDLALRMVEAGWLSVSTRKTGKDGATC